MRITLAVFIVLNWGEKRLKSNKEAVEIIGFCGQNNIFLSLCWTVVRDCFNNNFYFFFNSVLFILIMQCDTCTRIQRNLLLL